VTVSPSSSKKYGPITPKSATAHQTVTRWLCRGRSWSCRGLFSAQYRKFCLLTHLDKCKWALSLESTTSFAGTFCRTDSAFFKYVSTTYARCSQLHSVTAIEMVRQVLLTDTSPAHATPLQFSPTSYHFIHLQSNILLSNLFSNTLSLCTFLNVGDQVSNPYKPTSKIIGLYIIIFVILDSGREDKRFWTKWYQALP
jgi:hypothetical protein